MSQDSNSIRGTPGPIPTVILSYLLIGALMSWCAGRSDVPGIWLGLGVLTACHLVLAWTVLRQDPQLTRERFRPGPGVPLWDRIILWLTGGLILAGLALGSADVGHYQWTRPVAWPLQLAGAGGIVCGMALLGWSMAENTWFSKVVRIQSDRDHVVVDTGPYRWVRHPGYSGWILLWIGFNLAVGSWTAFALSLLTAAVVVLRTTLEDNFLQRNLPGYREYAARIRWKLVPKIW